MSDEECPRCGSTFVGETESSWKCGNCGAEWPREDLVRRRTGISVSEPDVRRHLFEQGHVYTFRSGPDRTVGLVWGRVRRGGSKIFDGWLEHVERVSSPSDFETEWAAESGFGGRSGWIAAVDRQHGTAEGSVYRLEVDEWTVDDPTEVVVGD